MTRSPHPTTHLDLRGRRPRVVVLVAALVAALLLPLAPAHAAKVSLPLEAFASYEPADLCTPGIKPGTKIVAAWLKRNYGSSTTMARACEWGDHVTSEHQEGRAIDWFADAATAKGRAQAKKLIDGLLASDRWGNKAVRARRMGVMYIIWNDQIYSSGREFRPEPYLNSGCKTRAKCSKTLRHRDHVHISLSWAAARAKTSWYVGR